VTSGRDTGNGRKRQTSIEKRQVDISGHVAREGMSVGYVGTDRVTSGRDTAMGGGQLNISGQVAREGMSVGYVGKARVTSGRVTGMGGKTQASTEKGRLDKSGQVT